MPSGFQAREIGKPTKPSPVESQRHHIYQLSAAFILCSIHGNVQILEVKGPQYLSVGYCKQTDSTKKGKLWWELGAPLHSKFPLFHLKTTTSRTVHLT